MLKVQNIYHGKFLLFQVLKVKEYTLELKRYKLMKSITDKAYLHKKGPIIRLSQSKIVLFNSIIQRGASSQASLETL